MKPHTFKIYPFRKSKAVFDKTTWWRVLLFDSKEEMKSATVDQKCDVCGHVFISTKNHAGLTHSHGFRQRVDEFGQVVKAKPEGELGIIFIQKENDGSGVVSHELFHATMYTVMRYTTIINFDAGNFSQADEKMAHINGDLNNSYWVHVLKFKI